MAGPFDYLFNDRDTSNNLGVNVAARTPVSPPPDSDDPVAADPSQAAGALLDNIVFPRNNRRTPIFKDAATASAYEAGLRDFMKATGRTDMDPYGVSGRFYYPGIDRRGDPFSTNNRGMTQESIDSINRLAYNQYLGLVSGKGFRKGGEGDPVPGYAPALKLGSDTPMGRVVSDPNADEPVGIFSLLGRGNVPRVLDDMGVNYSTQGIEAAMGDPRTAVVPNVASVSPAASEIANAAQNAKVFGAGTDSSPTANVAEVLLNDEAVTTVPATNQKPSGTVTLSRFDRPSLNLPSDNLPQNPNLYDESQLAIAEENRRKAEAAQAVLDIIRRSEVVPITAAEVTGDYIPLTPDNPFFFANQPTGNTVPEDMNRRFQNEVRFADLVNPNRDRMLALEPVVEGRPISYGIAGDARPAFQTQPYPSGIPSISDMIRFPTGTQL